MVDHDCSRAPPKKKNAHLLKKLYFERKIFGKNEICAFCTAELTLSDAKELKTLIQNEWKVQPSCGQPACLSLNPKADYNNG